MAEFSYIKVPTFDLCFIQLTENGPASHVIFAGGGGSAKTGVKNQLVVAKRNYADGRFQCIQFFETDSKERSVLCSGVYSGFINVSIWIC